MNKVILSGRIANDLQLRKTRDGVSVLGFNLAVKRPHKKDTTDFIRVSTFRQNADYLNQYAKKGTLIGVTGIITTGSYQGQNGEVKTTEVAAEEVEILESKQREEKQEDFVVTDDDLPF